MCPNNADIMANNGGPDQTVLVPERSTLFAYPCF